MRGRATADALAAAALATDRAQQGQSQGQGQGQGTHAVAVVATGGALVDVPTLLVSLGLMQSELGTQVGVYANIP